MEYDPSSEANFLTQLATLSLHPLYDTFLKSRLSSSAVNSRDLCGANLVTYPADILGNEAHELHRVVHEQPEVNYLPRFSPRLISLEV